MAITNQSKPNVATPETYLEIGGGFFLTIGNTFKLIIGALGLGGMTNVSKVSIGETWGSIATTWSAETRTWLAVSQLVTNTARTAYGDPLWNAQLVWQLSLPWQVESAIMTNFDKP
jgi:hypothetical protein